MFGRQIILYPLRLTPLVRLSYDVDLSPSNSAQYVNLVFEPVGDEYQCMACAEARGVAMDRLLSPGEIESHAKGHQFGYDYALYIQKKMEVV